jgi:hypothetical protein
MFIRSEHTSPKSIALLAAILSTAALGIALPMSDQTSTIFDPVGDTIPHFHAPAFQDFVFGQMTKTASGDFELLMEMAGPVPLDPTIPPPASAEIWWLWGFNLDPAAAPRGYPSAPGTPAAPEFLVYVSWDGAEFAGTAIDRRPLLTGGKAIVTPVPFSIDGTIVEAYLPYALIGPVPPSFEWRLRTIDYSGPVGSAAWFPVDLAETVFNP